jgi:hypothetical protein
MALVCACVLLATTLTAGARYVFCKQSRTVHAQACCKGAARREVPAIARWVPTQSCCESKVVADAILPGLEHIPFYVAARSTVEAALAWNPAAPLGALGQRKQVEWPIRAGPSGALARCVRLQVFLS